MARGKKSTNFNWLIAIYRKFSNRSTERKSEKERASKAKKKCNKTNDEFDMWIASIPWRRKNSEILFFFRIENGV